MADDAPPREGDELELLISSGGDRIELTAHVSWQRGPQFGLEFYASPEERRRKLVPLFRNCVADEETAESAADS